MADGEVVEELAEAVVVAGVADDDEQPASEPSTTTARRVARPTGGGAWGLVRGRRMRMGGVLHRRRLAARSSLGSP